MLIRISVFPPVDEKMYTSNVHELVNDEWNEKGKKSTHIGFEF